MPIISQNITTTAAGDNAIDLANGEDAFILPGVTVAALGGVSRGVYGVGGSTVEVYGGVISAESMGIWLDLDSGSPEGGNHVLVAETGTVSAASVGIWARGDANTIVNEGMVTSRGSVGIIAEGPGSHVTVSSTGTVSALVEGVYVDGGSNTVINDGAVTSRTHNGIQASGGLSTVINSGHVAAHLIGIDVDGSGNRVVNSGTITADSGIRAESLAGEANRIVNYGTISAANAGVQGGAGDETVINRGAIEGSASLGAGADIYGGEDGVVLGEVLGGDGNDRLFGGSFDDALFGGVDNDLLKGRAGDDIIGGGAGTDSLWGGSGLDVFDFDALADSAVGLGRDVVADFERGFDLVDLQGIDARAGAAGDQAFRFVGTAAFTAGSAGQLRAFTNAAGTQTIVEGDVDGDATADFQITLAGSVALSAADFLL